MQTAIMGIIRHAMTTLGGGLVANGYMGSDELSSGIGAVITLIGLAWSVIEKRGRQ